MYMFYYSVSWQDRTTMNQSRNRLSSCFSISRNNYLFQFLQQRMFILRFGDTFIAKKWTLNFNMRNRASTLLPKRDALYVYTKRNNRVWNSIIEHLALEQNWK